MTPPRDKTDRRMRRLAGRPDWRRTLRRFARRTRRRLGLPRSGRSQALVALGAVVTAIVVWGVFDVVAARRDLLAARNDLTAAASNLGTATDADATTSLRAATKEAVARTSRAASRLKRAPLLRLVDVIPVVNQQRRGLLGAVDLARDAATVGDALAAEVERVRAGLTVRNAAVDLEALASLADATGEAGAALSELPAAYRSGQWGPLARATRDLDEVVVDTARRLTRGSDTMRVARRLLGAERPSRILLALQNNAEMRDQGMVLSYAVAEAQAGSLRITKSGSVTDLELSAPVRDLSLPPGTAVTFGQLAPLQYWQSVNATADTAIAGASMASMYRAATGDAIDGVVALDVPAIASLLSLTGPVSVPGIPQPITAQNAAQVLLHDLYAMAGQDRNEARTQRQRQLAAVTTAVIERIRASSLNTSALVRTLGAAAAGGHAWVTSVLPSDQAALERAGLSGRPGRVAAERTIHLSVQNGTATKLDWFVDPIVDVDVTVTPDGTAVVNTSVTVPNSAPSPTPSSEQFGPDNMVTSIAGLYRARVYFWGPKGGDQIDSVEESGLRVNLATTDVPPGERRSVRFSTILVDAVKGNTLRLRFVPQPRVRPMKLRVNVAGLGWKVEPARTETLDWDRTLHLEWELRR